MLAAFSAVPGRLFSPFNETLDLASDTGDTLELLRYPNGARALACLTQKSGSTEWKRLILMAITGERADNPHIFHGFLAANGKSDAVEVASADEVAQPTSEYEDVVKFIIARNHASHSVPLCFADPSPCDYWLYGAGLAKRPWHRPD